jgi:hypothetical protein
MNSLLKRINISKYLINNCSKRGVIGSSHTSQRDDEVFMSRLSGEKGGIVVFFISLFN